MMSREPTSPLRKTHTAQALFLIAGGFVASAQIGKIIVAMPLIQAEMRLGIGVVSLLIAVFATLGSLFGLGAGIVARRLGARRCLVGGMLTIAAASAAGAFAQNVGSLLASRIAEGVGFLAVVVAVPDLLSRTATEKDRAFVFALWGAYMPTGSALMLLTGPFLPQFGWRRLWLAAAVVAVLYALAAALVLRRQPDAKPAGDDLRSFLRESASVLHDPASLLLAAVLGLYTFQYFTIAGFLPVLLVSALHLDLAAASLITTLAVIANACGNIAAGVLQRFGVPLWLNMLVTLAFFVVAAPLIFSAGLPLSLVAFAAALTLGIGGLLPASIFAAVPFFATRRSLLTPTMGLLQQTSNLGQFAGPLTTGLVIAHFGWPAAPIALIPAAAIGVAVVFWVRRRMVAVRGGPN